MKKRIIYALLFTIMLVLSACSNGDIDDNDHHANGIHAPKNIKKITEKDIFSSNKQNKKLSEKEMNQAIQKYLDVNSIILDNKYLMQSKLDKQSDSQNKVTDKQAKELSQLSNNAVKNDMHFKNFVKNNTLPKGYEANTERIIKYFHALNSTISDVDKSIEELNYQPQNSINVVDVPTHYAGDVNGKVQNKIKSFLNDKHIKTDVFDK